MKWNLPFFNNSVCGVELAINSEGNHSFSYVILKKSGSKIDIEKSESGLISLEQLFGSIGEKLPLIISIKGKGIIYKKIPVTPDENFESLLNKTLPNSNINDFYVQSFFINEANAIIAIARKNLVDLILNSFEKESYKVIGCILGPFCVQSILPLLLSGIETSSELKFSNHEFLIRDANIVNYISLANEEPLKKISPNTLSVDSNLLVAFASAFSYFNPGDSTNSNIASVLSAYDEFKNEVKFKKAGVIVLGASFLILLINFIVFTHLSDQVKSKSTQLLFSSGEMNMIDSLKYQIDERMVILTKSGLSEPSRTSFYADEIAKDLPEEITLTSINIQPLKKDENDEKKIQFESKKVLVSGVSKFSLDVNEWIRRMRAKDWVQSITLLNYKQRENDNLGEFLLEIKLK